MTPKEYAALSKECCDTLDRYHTEGHKMCDLLAAADHLPWTPQYRHTLNDQRIRENETHRQYMEVRHRLIDAAKVGFEAEVSRD
jgi:hypothetical protein